MLDAHQRSRATVEGTRIAFGRLAIRLGRASPITTAYEENLKAITSAHSFARRGVMGGLPYDFQAYETLHESMNKTGWAWLDAAYPWLGIRRQKPSRLASWRRRGHERELAVESASDE